MTSKQERNFRDEKFVLLSTFIIASKYSTSQKQFQQLPNLKRKKLRAPEKFNSELTKRRRRRQRRRYKTIGSGSKNNCSARSARAFYNYIVVHFFAIIS